MRRVKKSGLALILLVFGLYACDSSTGVKDTPPQPEIPSLYKAQPELNSFTSSGSTEGSFNDRSTTYDQALNIIELVQRLFFGSDNSDNGPGLVFGFLEAATMTEPEYDGSQWVWDYSRSEGDYSVNITLTAQVDEEADQVDWLMKITTNIPNGNNLEDYTYLQGTSNIEGTEGDFDVFSLLVTDSETPKLEAEWQLVSEDELSTSYTFNPVYFDIGGGESQTIEYERLTPEHTITFSSSSETYYEIYWDEDSGVGYLAFDGSRICWDASKETVPCSDVGLEQ
jgi:hypothetical protein